MISNIYSIESHDDFQGWNFKSFRRTHWSYLTATNSSYSEEEAKLVKARGCLYLLPVASSNPKLFWLQNNFTVFGQLVLSGMPKMILDSFMVWLNPKCSKSCSSASLRRGRVWSPTKRFVWGAFRSSLRQQHWLLCRSEVTLSPVGADEDIFDSDDVSPLVLFLVGCDVLEIFQT